MSEIGPDRNNEATIGLSPDGKFCIMTIPVEKYANDEIDGNAMVYGKMRELQAHVMQVVNEIRLKKASLGLIKVKSKPPTDLSVA